MKFIDMFAGIGGFRTGLENAGHECVGFIEWDKYARQSYEAIYDIEGEFTAHDIQQVRGRELPDADIWTFGSPCQDISVAGKQAGLKDGKASSMFFEVIRLLEERIANKETQPSYLIMENVKNLLSSNGGRDFATVLFEMDKVGYDAEWAVLNSSDVVPQNRERVYIIGHLRGASTRQVFPITGESGTAYSKPEKIGNYGENRHQSNLVYSNQGLSPALTATDFKHPVKVGIKQVGNIGNKKLMGGNPQNGRVYLPSGLSPTLNTMQGGGRESKILIKNSTKQGFVRGFEGDGVDLSYPNSKTRRGRVQSKRSNTLETSSNLGVVVKRPLKGKTNNGWHFEQECFSPDSITGTLKAGGGSGNIPKVVKPVLTPDRLNKRQNGRRFKEDGEPEFTLTGQDRHGVLIEEQNELTIRKLTPLECWRLQGFSDEQFYKAKKAGVSASQLYKQAGNAVTTKVVEQIGQRLKVVRDFLEKLEMKDFE